MLTGTTVVRVAPGIRDEDAARVAARTVERVLGYVNDLRGTVTVSHNGYRVYLHAGITHFATVANDRGDWWHVDIRWDWDAEDRQWWVLLVRSAG